MHTLAWSLLPALLPSCLLGITHFVSTNVPNEDTETQKVTWGGWRWGPLTKQLPDTVSQFPRVGGFTSGSRGEMLHGRQEGIQLSACPHPTPTLHLQGKCLLCAAHMAHCVAASIQVGAEPYSLCRAWHCLQPLAEHRSLHICTCIYNQSPWQSRLCDPGPPTTLNRYLNWPAPGPASLVTVAGMMDRRDT